MEGGDEISLDEEEELEEGALSHVTNTRIVKLEAREEAPLKNNMIKVILLNVPIIIKRFYMLSFSYIDDVFILV